MSPSFEINPQGYHPALASGSNGQLHNFRWPMICTVTHMALDDYLAPNRGGIKRGDRADTGDLQAQPTETADRSGSGAQGGGGGAEGQVTGNPSALGRAEGPTDLKPGGNLLDELTVHEATDPELVLTAVRNRPPEDWAADTGAPESTEAEAPSHKR